MDTTTSEKVTSPELVRESLMAISQSIPDVIVASTHVSAKSVAPTAVDQNGVRGTEEYRSKLISISYTSPPDVEPTPPVAGNVGA